MRRVSAASGATDQATRARTLQAAMHCVRRHVRQPAAGAGFAAAQFLPAISRRSWIARSRSCLPSCREEIRRNGSAAAQHGTVIVALSSHSRSGEARRVDTRRRTLRISRGTRSLQRNRIPGISSCGAVRRWRGDVRQQSAAAVPRSQPIRNGPVVRRGATPRGTGAASDLRDIARNSVRTRVDWKGSGTVNSYAVTKTKNE